MKGLIKRKYDLVIQAGDLAAGAQLLVNVAVPIDAPFVLKARTARCQYRPAGVSEPGQTRVGNLAWRFAGPDEQFYAADMVPWAVEAPNFAQTPNGLWLQNSIVYPPGSSIQAYITNIGNTTIPGLELYYLGYQLFDCGQVPNLTYPPRIRTNPYWLVSGAGVPIVPTQWNGQLSPLLQVTDFQPLLMLNAPSDGDFVLRTAGCISPSNLNEPGTPPYPLEVHIQLRDWTQKAYSNLPVHVDVLFGQYPGFIDTAATTPGTPGYQAGLFVPEIYIPKNQFLYYDLYRADAYLSTTFGLSPQPESFVIGWKGAKVYAQ